MTCYVQFSISCYLAEYCNRDSWYMTHVTSLHWLQERLHLFFLNHDQWVPLETEWKIVMKGLCPKLSRTSLEPISHCSTVNLMRQSNWLSDVEISKCLQVTKGFTRQSHGFSLQIFNFINTVYYTLKTALPNDKNTSICYECLLLHCPNPHDIAQHHGMFPIHDVSRLENI